MSAGNEQLDQFKQILRAHNQWLASDRKGEGRGHIQNQILEDKNFDNFPYGKITNVKFIKCRFTNGNFANSDLESVTFENCKLSDVSFNGANLRVVTFINCELSSLKFVGSNIINLLLSDSCQVSSVTFDNSSIIDLELNSSKLESLTFRNVGMNALIINGSQLNNCSFSQLKTSSHPIRIENESVLIACSFNSADLHNMQISNSKVAADFLSAKIAETFRVSGESDLRGSSFNGTVFSKCEFEGVKLTSVSFNDAQIKGGIFRNCELSGANFTNSKLEGADLRGSEFNSSTQFSNASVNNCQIERSALELLENYGGLTKGSRMRMKIEDPVLVMRSTYSGFQQYIHLLAVAIFTFPYAWFFLRAWYLATSSSADTSEGYVSLLKGFSLFVFNGGSNMQAGEFHFSFSFIIFCYMFFYNVLRLILLSKTKQLEIYQDSSNLPAQFSLKGSNWGTAFAVARWGFRIQLIFVAINTWLFLQLEIPLNQL